MADKDESGPSTAATKVKMQMQKMQEANSKYKNLLKLAKERIQQQDDELKRLKGKTVNLPHCVDYVFFNCCKPFLHLHDKLTSNLQADKMKIETTM